MSIYGSFLESASSVPIIKGSDMIEAPKAKIATGFRGMKPLKPSLVKSMATDFLGSSPIKNAVFSGLGKDIMKGKNIESHAKLSLNEDAMLLEGLFGKKKAKNPEYDVKIIGKTGEGELVGMCPDIKVRGTVAYLYDSKYYSILSEDVVHNCGVVANYCDKEFAWYLCSTFNYVCAGFGDPTSVNPQYSQASIAGCEKPYRVEIWEDVHPTNNQTCGVCVLLCRCYPELGSKEVKDYMSNIALTILIYPYTGKVKFGYKHLD